MKKIWSYMFTFGLVLTAGDMASGSDQSPESFRLSNEFPPEVACWFWDEADFKPGGYKEKIDLFSQHTSFTLLTASFRAGRREPLTDPAVFRQVKEAVDYAKAKGIGIVPEFSMWSDLTGFLRAYPEELCYIVTPQTIPMAAGVKNEVMIASPAFDGCPSLHYEPGGRPDVKLPPAQLLKTYSYELTNGLIKAGSLAEITHLCHQRLAPAQGESALVDRGGRTDHAPGEVSGRWPMDDAKPTRAENRMTRIATTSCLALCLLVLPVGSENSVTGQGWASKRVSNLATRHRRVHRLRPPFENAFANDRD